jgi:hypothetical protein
MQFFNGLNIIWWVQRWHVADIRTCVLVRHYGSACLGGVMAVLEALASYISHT